MATPGNKWREQILVVNTALHDCARQRAGGWDAATQAETGNDLHNNIISLRRCYKGSERNTKQAINHVLNDSPQLQAAWNWFTDFYIKQIETPRSIWDPLTNWDDQIIPPSLYPEYPFPDGPKLTKEVLCSPTSPTPNLIDERTTDVCNVNSKKIQAKGKEKPAKRKADAAPQAILSFEKKRRLVQGTYDTSAVPAPPKSFAEQKNVEFHVSWSCQACSTYPSAKCGYPASFRGTACPRCVRLKQRCIWWNGPYTPLTTRKNQLKMEIEQKRKGRSSQAKAPECSSDVIKVDSNPASTTSTVNIDNMWKTLRSGAVAKRILPTIGEEVPQRNQTSSTSTNLDSSSTSMMPSTMISEERFKAFKDEFSALLDNTVSDLRRTVNTNHNVAMSSVNKIDTSLADLELRMEERLKNNFQLELKPLEDRLKTIQDQMGNFSLRSTVDELLKSRPTVGQMEVRLKAYPTREDVEQAYTSMPMVERLLGGFSKQMMTVQEAQANILTGMCGKINLHDQIILTAIGYGMQGQLPKSSPLAQFIQPPSSAPAQTQPSHTAPGPSSSSMVPTT